jgi:DNA-binding phage protein
MSPQEQSFYSQSATEAVSKGAVSTPAVGAISIEERQRIETLLTTVSPKSPVRGAVETLLADPTATVPLEPLYAVLRRPSWRRWREQQLAVWALARLAERNEQREKTVDAFAKVLSGDFSAKMWAYIGAVILMPLMITQIIMWRKFEAHSTFTDMFDTFFDILVYYSLFMSSKATFANPVREEAAGALGKLRAVEALDSLVQAELGALNALHPKMRKAIFSLLPALTPDHYGKLQTRTLRLLAIMLEDQMDEKNAHLILHALDKVGDRSVLPILNRIARGKGRAGRLPSVRAAASQVIAHIEERLAKHKESDLLLRIASETSSSANLLRPSKHDSEEDIALLLRAAVQNQNDHQLVCSILDDLKRRGDRRAVPALHELLKLPELPPEVEAAARECLLTLQQNA